MRQRQQGAVHDAAVADELRQAWLSLGFAQMALSKSTVALGVNDVNRDVMNDVALAVSRAHGHLSRARSLTGEDFPELDAVLTPRGPLLALVSDTAAFAVAVRDGQRIERARSQLAEVFAARGLTPPDDLGTGLSTDERWALRPDLTQLALAAAAVAGILWLLLR
jgi:hypothetical protein